jgi:hypothetical protein
VAAVFVRGLAWPFFSFFLLFFVCLFVLTYCIF